MRKCFIVLLLVLAADAQTFIRQARPDALIEINAAKPADYRIPRTIYGTFLEPIGHSVYGGLWAQELENPSFEDNLWNPRTIARMIQNTPGLQRGADVGLPLPWEPLDGKQGMRYEPRWGDAANSARSLLVMGLPGQETGVRQRVYLPVHRVSALPGQPVGQARGRPGRNRSLPAAARRCQNVLARQAIPLAGQDWQRYEFRLELPAGRIQPLEPADFVISLRDEARVLVDQAFLFPADAVDGMDPDMVAMSRALKTPVVRYGGNFTSGYHWRDGIGPMDKRVTMFNESWGMPEYNHFGTDEFLRFCRLIGAEPQIALNLGSGTPREAAAWVKYVNEHWGSGGLLWELGNELYGNWQIGYPTLERIAPRTRAFSEAVRAVDPQSRLIATGNDPDQPPAWNAAQLEPWRRTRFNYLSTHFVVGSAQRAKNATPEFVAAVGLRAARGPGAAPARDEAADRRRSATRNRVGIAFTEWLFHGNNQTAPQFSNMGGAICTAGFLNTLMRVADFTPIADMTGLIEFGGIWKARGQVYGVPAYWAFRMYSNTDATIPVESRTTVEGYDVEQGNTRIPSIPDVPYLDIVAAMNDARDRLTVFAVNRHATHDIPAHIQVAGFRPGGKARILTLDARSFADRNDEAQPEAVHPVESAVAVPGARFDYTFPRGSVTVIELGR